MLRTLSHYQAPDFVEELTYFDHLSPRQTEELFRLWIFRAQRDSLFFRNIMPRKYYAVLFPDSIFLLPGAYFLHLDPRLPEVKRLNQDVKLSCPGYSVSQIATMVEEIFDFQLASELSKVKMYLKCLRGVRALPSLIRGDLEELYHRVSLEKIGRKSLLVSSSQEDRVGITYQIALYDVQLSQITLAHRRRLS